MRDDPCFSCTLPDCDDGHPHCVLRQLQRSYNNKSRRGDRSLVTADELAANSAIYESWLLERLAQAAEGVRPLSKPNSRWKHGEPRPIAEPMRGAS